jgi:hypothetical protein
LIGKLVYGPREIVNAIKVRPVPDVRSPERRNYRANFGIRWPRSRLLIYFLV